MPNFSTSVKVNTAPSYWSVEAGENLNAHTKKDFITEHLDRNGNRYGSIYILSFANLKGCPVISVCFLDSTREKNMALYQQYLRQFGPSVPLKVTNPIYYQLDIPCDSLADLSRKFIPVVRAINLINPLPLDMLVHLSKLLHLDYNKITKESILSELYESHQDDSAEYTEFNEAKFLKHYERALLLAKASSNLEMYLVIAEDCLRHGLNIYALKAARQGLALYQTQPVIALYTKPETLNGLNFHAGKAIRQCSVEAMKEGSYLEIALEEAGNSGADVKANADANAAADRKGAAEVSGKPVLSLDDGEIASVASPAKEAELQKLETVTQRLSQGLDFLNAKVQTEEDRLYLALAYFLQVEPTSKYNKVVEQAATEINTSLSSPKLAGALVKENRIPIYSKEQMLRTLFNLNAKMRLMQDQISEQTALLSSGDKKEASAAAALLEKHRKEAETATKALADTKAEMKAKLEAAMASESSLKASYQSLKTQFDTQAKEQAKMLSSLKEKDTLLATKESEAVEAQRSIAKAAEENETLTEKLNGLKEVEKTHAKLQIDLKVEREKAACIAAELATTKAELERMRVKDKAVSKLEASARGTAAGSPGSGPASAQILTFSAAAAASAAAVVDAGASPAAVPTSVVDPMPVANTLTQ